MNQDYPASSTEPVCPRPVDAMTNDYRAMCAELVDSLRKHTSMWEGHEIDLVTRARALLAQPVPKVPTKAELRQIFDDQSGYINDDQVMWWSDFQAAAKALQQRYAQ